MRKTVNGRPSGTDGSDFSYRMVVDSRYKKVAQGRSRLAAIIFIQTFIQFMAALIFFRTTPNGVTLDRLSLSPTIIVFISLLVGEIGRKRSRSNFLKFYLFGSSVSGLISVAFLLKSEKSFKVITDLRISEASGLEILKIAAVILGLLVQVFALSVTTALIRNMAPPKKTV